MLDLSDLDPAIQRTFISANGLRFDTLTCGEGDRLALCLHGFPEHAYSWRHQMPYLATLGYRVWAPCLRGYGDTDRPRGKEHYGFSTLLDDVAALIDASAAKEITLIAHDWGAVLAWAFAIHQIRPLQQLIILNVPHPAVFAQHVYRWPQIARSWYIFFFQIPWIPDFALSAARGFLTGESIRLMAVDKSAFPEHVLKVYRYTPSQPYGSTAMINYYRGLVQRSGGFRGSQTPPQITTPTLMIWGEEDKALGLELTQGTEAFVEDFTLHTLPGVSHWVQQEAPEKVNDLIGAWIKQKRSEN